MEIVDVEKRKGLTKYYVYILRVTRKDGSKYVICRSFSQFTDMQSHLEERFVVEAGAMNPKDRVLPNLPSKIYLGRSNVREVTDKRVPLLNEYLKGLFALPNNIRYNSIVMAFVKPTSEDRNYCNEEEEEVVAKSKSLPRRPPPPTAENRPPVRPAVPAAPPPMRSRPPPSIAPPPLPRFLPPPSTAPPPLPSATPPPKVTLVKKTSVSVTPGWQREKPVPRGKALYSYTAQHDDELSFSEGTIIYLLSQSGQWYEGKMNGKTGMVPVNYLRVIEPLAPTENVTEAKLDGQQSDEWDEDTDNKETLTYHFYDEKRTIDVEKDTLEHPTVSALLRLIRGHLKRRDIVLNYKDRTGDLIEITDKKDIEMMKREVAQDGWTFHVTRSGDLQVYHTHPYA